MIKLGGKQRPVRFGFAALYQYEETTGRKALQDFATLSIDPQNISVKTVTDIAFCGLSCGHQSLSQTVTFTEFDVADWVMGDEKALTKIFNLFEKSFPKAKEAKSDEAAPGEA
jgi:hypothetical protein